MRIPPGVDVPLTDRVRRLIDTAAFRRLAHISQLGLVSLVYPAANHSRHEHSLGVFLAAIEYLDRLAADERFAAAVSPKDAEVFLAAALLHDVGHWPFGHPIEDLHLPQIAGHEKLGRRYDSRRAKSPTCCATIGSSIRPTSPISFPARRRHRAQRILRSMLSGPIDVDKIDYLTRDSLHAGVPYGQHFDRRRLINSLCLNEAGDALAITDKGKTAAEMMVFARYVMFSEVYWHHAVRSATAMFQRAFYLLHDSLDLERICRIDRAADDRRPARRGRERPGRRFARAASSAHAAQLYKRLAQYSYFEEPHMYRPTGPPAIRRACAIAAEAIAATLIGRARRSWSPLTKCSSMRRRRSSKSISTSTCISRRERIYRRLGEISPVVRTLAQEQFDDYVKRVRIFIHARLAAKARRLPDLKRYLVDALDG